jgi:hypothetical protein
VYPAVTAELDMQIIAEEEGKQCPFGKTGKIRNLVVNGGRIFLGDAYCGRMAYLGIAAPGYA